MSSRTRAAKAVYRLSGWVGRIQTYQRMHRVVWDEPEADGTPRFHTVPGDRAKVPIHLTWRLFALANRLDTEHFDHWAFVHDECEDATACERCGGMIDPPDQEEADG